jgi:hypothetical protein
MICHYELMNSIPGAISLSTSITEVILSEGTADAEQHQQKQDNQVKNQ